MIGILLILILLIVIFAWKGVKIIRPYQKGVVERLGKYQKTLEPGLVFIIPFVDKVTKVDMRENVVSVPAQEVITKDNVAVTVDAVVYYEATDPVRLIYNVKNFIQAATTLAQTNLRNVIGELQLDESLSGREQISSQLRTILDEATDKWGVRIVRVELQRIDPPADVTQAMHRQMKAERERRATILEAEGERESAIAKAEGYKQATIKEAEGRATAIKEVAAAEKEQRILAAQGESEAIRQVFEAIHEGDPTDDLLAVRYIDALKDVANGNATKIFMPIELSSMASAAGGIGEMLKSGFEEPAKKEPAKEDSSAAKRDTGTSASQQNYAASNSASQRNYSADASTSQQNYTANK